MGSGRTAAPLAVLSALMLASSVAATPAAGSGSDVSASALLSPFPIVQVTGKVAKRGTKLRRLAVVAPAGATVTGHCRGRGCPFRSKAYAAGGTIRIRKLESRLLRNGVVIEISVTSPDAVGKYTRLKVRKGRPPSRSDSCLMPGDATPVACPSSSGGSTFDLSDGSVTSGKLADSAVTSAKIAADAVSATAIAADAVTSSEIAADAVGSDEIAADAVTTSEILDGTVTTADISQSVWSSAHMVGTLAARPPADPSNSGYLYLATDDNLGTLYRSDGTTWVKAAAGVSEASIPDGSIDTAKLANDAVDNGTLQDNAVTSAEVANDTITSADIFDGTITGSDIGADTVGAGNIGANAVMSNELADNAVDNGALQDNAVTSAEIVNGTIASADIADGTIASADIADGTIATGDLSSTIGGEAVNTANIRDNAVNSAKILAGAVTNTKLGTDSVTSTKITDLTIIANDLADGAVTSAKIFDGTVTSTDIADGTIASADILDGTITSADILNGTIASADIADGTIQTGALAAGAAGESLYRLVENRSGKLDRDAGASNYVLPAGDVVGANALMEEGVDLERDAGAFYLASADHALTGRTTQLRLRATLLANSTAPGVTVKVGLYPVTANGGGNDKNNVTLGTVVSEVTFSGISANSRYVQTGSAFSFPSDGFYVIGVNTSGSLNNNSLVDITADLHVRNF